MNPSSNETPGMQLPPPVMEQAVNVAGAESKPSQPSQPEQAPTSSERAPTASPSPTAGLPPITLALPPIPAPADGQSTATTVSPGVTGATVDDHDLIEKEWVNKAKQIVERTKDDPHQQSEELTVFKADYMQKHYGKTIKLSK